MDRDAEPEAALRAFGVDPGRATVSELAGGLSARTWRVREGADGFVLRRHPDGEPGAFAQSELALLAALDAAGVPGPAPCLAADGGFLWSDGAGRGWSLARWVEGRHLDRLPDEELAAAIGELLGRMHSTAAGWKRPEWFQRPVYDGGWFRRQREMLERALPPAVPPEDWRVIGEGVRVAASRLDRLAADPGETGIIHADPHDGNLLLAGPDARPVLIDYGRCGTGCRALDLAMAQHYLGEETWSGLTRGYRRAARLSAAAEEAMPALRLLALTDNLATLAGFPDEAAGVAADLAELRDQARSVIGGAGLG